MDAASVQVFLRAYSKYVRKESEQARQLTNRIKRRLRRGYEVCATQNFCRPRVAWVSYRTRSTI